MPASQPWGLPRSFLLLLTLWLLGNPVWAHNEEEDTTLTITIDGQALMLEYQTKFPSMASFVRLKQLDTDKNGEFSAAEKAVFAEKRLAEYLKNVELRVGGQPISLSPELSEAKVGTDVLGLRDLSVRYRLRGRMSVPWKTGESLFLKDPSFGWNRYQVSGSDGATFQVTESSVGDTMEVRRVGSKAGSNASQAKSKIDSHDDDQLRSMLKAEMTPWMLASTLGIAFVLGALHALTPGHGKTMVAAYLVGSRGTIKQAFLLGLVVTVTHTASVFLLGLACMVAFQFVVPDKIIPWLGFISGLLVTVVGAALLWSRWTGRELGHSHSHGHGHSHSHESHQHSHQPHSHSHQSHQHTHEPHSYSHQSHHQHSHESHHQVNEPASAPTARQVPDAPDAAHSKLGLWSLIGLGVSGGMVPCPEALVVLLAAISLNKLFLGMLVLIFFSLGLAALLVVIGILVVSATRMSKRYYPSEETIRKVSIASYIFICGMGLVIAVRSLTSAGILVINL